MKTKSKYQDDIKALLEQAASLDTKATHENRDLNEAELLVKNEILDTVEEYSRIVATMERQERITAQLEQPQAAVTRPRPQKTEGVEVGDNRASKEKFGSFGQQLAAVMVASRDSGAVDPRLFNAASGLNETVPSEGGFLVQTDFAAELIKQVWETGVLASRCNRIPISGTANSIKINGMDETSRVDGSRGSGFQAYWQAEASEKTKSKPSFRQIELTLKKLIGLCYATDELMGDTAALEAIIRSGFNSEFGFKVDDGIINGTGAGQMLGILNSGGLVSVAKEVGQDADTLVAENIFKMYARLFPQSIPSAVWLINQSVQPQLYQMSLAVGTGGAPVFLPPGGMSQAPYGTLLGRPIIPIEQCLALGDKGDVILADLPNGYIIAEKGGLQSAMSIHVRFVWDEQVFRFVLRLDGQPVLASEVTPYKGTDTLGHFVTLNERA